MGGTIAPRIVEDLGSFLVFLVIRMRVEDFSDRPVLMPSKPPVSLCALVEENGADRLDVRVAETSGYSTDGTTRSQDNSKTAGMGKPDACSAFLQVMQCIEQPRQHGQGRPRTMLCSVPFQLHHAGFVRLSDQKMKRYSRFHISASSA